MSTVARSQRLIDSLVGKAGLTPAGKDWLVGALDPFHDLALKVEGYPDTCMSNSVVQLVKLSTTVAVPSGGNQWDCRIHMYPWLNQTQFTNMVLNGAASSPWFAYTGGANQYGAGGLCIDSSAAGTPIGQGQPVGSTSHQNITLPAQYYNGQCRVIGQAFEVHNTTSPLYKQGAVCVYKQPTPDYFDNQTVQVQGGSLSANGFGYPSIVTLPTAPFAQADALLLAGSKQWEAKDGCYVVGQFHSQQIPLQDLCLVQPVAYQANVPEGTGTYSMPTPGTAVPGSDAFTVLFYPDMFWSQQDACGAYFTGLSQQTVLTINWNILIERFPSAADTDLVVLASPSPRYDPIAMELYSQCLQDMPVGVPVAENGLGDWFMKVVSRARDIVMPALRVGSAIHPKIGMLVGAMDALGVSGKVKGGGGAQSNPSPFQNAAAQKKKNKNKGGSQKSFGPFALGTKQIHNMAKIISHNQQKKPAPGKSKAAKRKAKRLAKRIVNDPEFESARFSG